MNKIKVAHFASSIDMMGGGPSRSVPLLCKGLSELNLDINLITYKTANTNDLILRGTNVELTVLNLEKKLASFSLNFKRGLPLIDAQLFHGHGIWLPFYHWMAQYACKKGIPYIVTPRGTLEPYCLGIKKFKKKLALKAYQNADINKATCIHATGLMEANNLKKLGYVNPIAVIPNGIDLGLYPYQKRKHGEDSSRQVLFLSRIHPKKGLDLLIDAWDSICQENILGWNLCIVGNGDEKYINSLKIKIKNKKLENSVSILPPVFGNEKLELYKKADILILPTYSENFGMVIAEALACGVPVITTKNTPWECLEKNNCGWWIDLNVESIKTALMEAMALPYGSLIEMGINGRKCIEDEFSLDSVCTKTEELYQWILGKADRPSFII